MFGMRNAGKNAETHPVGPQTDLITEPSDSGGSMDPERPFASHYGYAHNEALLAFKAFHYGEEINLPGRLYSSHILPIYGRAASENIR